MERSSRIFSANVDGLVQEEAPGDGSEMEKKARCAWFLDLSRSEDPMTYVAMAWMFFTRGELRIHA